MNENRTAYYVSSDEETIYGIQEILTKQLAGCSLDNEDDRKRVADTLTGAGLVFLDNVADISSSDPCYADRLNAQRTEILRIIETHNAYYETWTTLAKELTIPMNKLIYFMPIADKFSAEAAAIVNLARNMGINVKYNAQTGEISLHE